MTSYLDQRSQPFTCQNPRCRKQFKEVLRQLLTVKEVSCPSCGTTINIEDSKRHGEIGKAFDSSNELDKQERER